MFKDFRTSFTIASISRKFYLDYLLVFIIALGVFGWLQSSFTLAEPDSFYHARMAVIMSEGKILHNFPWLNATSLKDNFADHHFLYHLLLIPAVKLFTPLIGVKVATVLFAGFLMLTIYWFLKKFQVKYPLLFIFLLFLSSPWLFRVSLVKAPALFLIVFLLSFYSLAHYYKWRFFFLSGISVWLYGAWPLIPLSGLLFLSLTLILPILFKNSFHNLISWIGKKRQAVFKTVAYGWLGILAGLVINPYFPVNLKFYGQQIIDIAVFNYHSVIGVGGEWYPYGFVKLLTDTPLSFILLILGLFFFILSFKKQSIYAWFFAALALGFLILTLKAKRQVEFFAPFSLIFFAFSFSDFYKKYFMLSWLPLIGRRWSKTFSFLLGLIILPFVLQAPFIFKQAKDDLDHGWPLNHYQAAAVWLSKNVPAGQVIFNADWDDFPFLFYYNPNNYYLTGLDPTFMYKHNQDKYWKYVNISLGKQSVLLNSALKADFNSRYVFLDQQHQALARNLIFTAGASKAYEDKEALIFRLND